tara:strand:- start:15289 stop:15441 length:153 start_codon:yes stop_codon:yes gene_type:complete
MARKGRKENKEEVVESKGTDEGYKDPTLFLFLWLGVPMILMFAYAIFGSH